MQIRRRVVVVGGGVSGLATAHFLHQAAAPSLEIALLESTDRLGGKVMTRQFSGHAALR